MVSLIWKIKYRKNKIGFDEIEHVKGFPEMNLRKLTKNKILRR